AAVAGDALFVDKCAASDADGLCGVWEPGARWPDLCVVWDRAVSADAAGGCGGNGSDARSVVAGICPEQSDAADSRDCGECEYECAAECTDGVGGVAISGVAGVLAHAVDGGCAGADLCDDSSALRAEHAGEQLHLSADTDGVVAAVAMGRYR